MAYQFNRHGTNITESRDTRPYDQGGPDGSHRGLNHTTTAIFDPGRSFQAACDYEGTFSPSPFSNSLGFQHAPPTLPPFPDHVHAEISYFELPISSPFASLASSASERSQPVSPSQPLTVSAPIPAVGPQANGRRYFECLICPKIFPRIARAEACLNGHFLLKPYACDGTCGDPNCDLEYGSIELLRRHRRPSDHRKTSCPTCKSSISKQNAARHKARCNKSRPA